MNTPRHSGCRKRLPSADALLHPSRFHSAAWPRGLRFKVKGLGLRVYLLPIFCSLVGYTYTNLWLDTNPRCLGLQVGLVKGFGFEGACFEGSGLSVWG